MFTTALYGTYFGYGVVDHFIHSVYNYTCTVYIISVPYKQNNKRRGLNVPIMIIATPMEVHCTCMSIHVYLKAGIIRATLI